MCVVSKYLHWQKEINDINSVFDADKIQFSRCYYIYDKEIFQLCLSRAVQSTDEMNQESVSKSYVCELWICF